VFRPLKILQYDSAINRSPGTGEKLVRRRRGGGRGGGGGGGEQDEKAGMRRRKFI